MILPWERLGRSSEGSVPLLLLHGFTGARQSFEHLHPALAERGEVLLVDLPGHAQAPLPEGAGSEGFRETLAALSKVLDEAGAGRVDVVGYSQGARLALGFAVEQPSRVRRLVLESGSAGLADAGERASRRDEDETRAARLERDGLEPFLAHWEQLPLFEGLRRLPEPRRSRLAARRRSHTAAGLAGALRTLGLAVQPDYTPQLHAVRAPTLLLTGRDDTKFTRIAQELAAELPNVWGCTFEGVGHAPHLEAPDLWLHEVCAFLKTAWLDAGSDAPEFGEKSLKPGREG